MTPAQVLQVRLENRDWQYRSRSRAGRYNGSTLALASPISQQSRREKQ